MAKSQPTADAIRARQIAAAREAAEHDAPLLDKAAGLLAKIEPLADELAALGPLLVVGYVPVQLIVVRADVARAVQAVANVQGETAALLTTDA